jgi:hypothetical protein
MSILSIALYRGTLNLVKGKLKEASRAINLADASISAKSTALTVAGDLLHKTAALAGLSSAYCWHTEENLKLMVMRYCASQREVVETD